MKLTIISVSICLSFLCGCASGQNKNVAEPVALLLVAVPAVIIASPFIAYEVISDSMYQPLKRGSNMDATIKNFGLPAFQYRCNNGKLLFEYEKDIKGLKKRFLLFNQNQEFIKATNNPADSCFLEGA